MKEFIRKPENLRRLEFWAATTIFVFAIFQHITNATNGPSAHEWVGNYSQFQDEGIYFEYYRHCFVPQLLRYIIIYAAFLLLNFAIIPRLLKQQAVALNILCIVLIVGLVGLGTGVTDTYLKAYLLHRFSNLNNAYAFFFRDSMLFALWLTFVFGFYTALKAAGIYLLSNTEAIQQRFRFLTTGTLIAIVLWIVSLFFLLVTKAEPELIALWSIMIPFAIALYSYSFHVIIPSVLPKRKPFRTYFGRVLLIVAVSLIPVILLGLIFSRSDDDGFIIGSFNGAFQLLITAPLTWIIYKRHLKGREEVYVLKKELGQSHAHFDFLRSQINPHFLFNALNTIYGTAMQENAERTSEGIERLGDMMRFMLQENMQEQISLSREIDYLNNYISLQKLRTDTIPGIQIMSSIEDQVFSVRIAPMLLIPFVENAFKHGISMREPSHIKITLEVKNNTLYFDVYNSKHAKVEGDPEVDKSGIGLVNVQERLKLLYPQKHELVIRDTAKDYFVHLTIKLAGPDTVVAKS